MAIINRAALKAQFRSGSVPASQDYYNLIDSMLVKRDDLFFGKWQPGIVYRPGDVVIYEKAIYCCITEDTDGCGCDDNGAEKEEKTLEPSKNGFCSILPPGKKGSVDRDLVNWQLLELDIEDEDWGIIMTDGEEPDIMYAKVFGKIGIGTQEPKARVHIHDESLKADFLFSPDNSAVPQLQIIKSEQPLDNLSISLTNNKAQFETGTEGFLFQLPAIITGGDETQQQADVDASSKIYLTAINNKPAIGVGSLAPAAAVELKEGLNKRLLLNPWNRSIPEILWSHHADAKQVYLSVQANATSAQLSTNADEGFYFKAGAGEDCDSYIKDGNNSGEKLLLSIKPGVKVGIGTDDPKAALDITDPENNRGEFLMSFRKSNPVFAIVNLRGEGNISNYLSVGPDNNTSIFITDSKNGFAFKKGAEYDANSGIETNINQGGTSLMEITSDGKVGIGENAEPVNYELDVFGNSRHFNVYVRTNEYTIEETGELKGKDILCKVRKLRPISFKWKGEYAFDKNEQYGLFAHEVQDIIKEVVKDSENNHKEIAYPNLVAVLVKAIQEQQCLIDDLVIKTGNLEKRIEALEANWKK